MSPAPTPTRCFSIEPGAYLPGRFRDLALLGVGSVVGAAAVVLLYEAGAVAGPVWLSLLGVGMVVLSQGYVVAKLGARYPSSAGIVTFLIQGHGRGRVTAVTSWLLYFVALVVPAMVAVSFGQYGSVLFFGGYAPWGRVLTTAVVLVVAAVNIAGARFIDRVWTLTVVVLLSVLAVFVTVALARLDPRLLAPATRPPTPAILGSVALTFIAHLGFISFLGDDLPIPGRNLLRAMYLALGITTALCVLIAAAAKPAFGDVGYVMMALVALLATSSSVNANIHAATGSTATLARTGLFPPVFGRFARVGGTRGLVISVLLVVLLANLVDLTAIATLGSVVVLVIFVVTALAAFRLRAEIGARTWLLVTGIALTVVVLAVFAVQTLRTAPQTFTAMIGVLALAVVLDLSWRRRSAARRSPFTTSPRFVGRCRGRGRG